jgi:hypothetical protein
MESKTVLLDFATQRGHAVSASATRPQTPILKNKFEDATSVSRTQSDD